MSVIERASAKPTRSKPRRRKVEHLYDLEVLTFAEDNGLPCRSLCGGYWAPASGLEPEVVHGARDFRADDCARCLVAHVRQGYVL